MMLNYILETHKVDGNMNLLSIIALIFSAAGIGISIWAIIAAKKSNKAAMRQNLEQELAGIKRELPSGEAQIMRVKAEGEEKNSHVFGVFPNPNEGEIKTLENKKSVLLNRQAEIIKQLQQL